MRQSYEQAYTELQTTEDARKAIINLARLLGRQAARQFVKDEQERAEKQLVAGDLNLRS